MSKCCIEDCKLKLPDKLSTPERDVYIDKRKHESKIKSSKYIVLAVLPNLTQDLFSECMKIKI